MRRPSKRVRQFIATGQRNQALTLATAQDSPAWNAWRQETDIFGDHLKTRINLSDADLAGLTLQNFLLTNVSFYKADLSGANLSGTNCSYADFHLANLVRANLSGASLKNARLSRAYLRSANLDGADLHGADLRRASVTGASMNRVDLRGVDLSFTRGITQEQIDRSVGDARTKLPPHVTRPDIWDIYEDDDGDDDLESLESLPATVEVAVNGGKLELSGSPGDAFFSSSIDPSSIKQELIDHVNRIAPRIANSGELSTALSRYLESLLSSHEDVIILGLRGVHLQNVFEGIEKSASDGGFEMLPDIKGAVRGIIVQHFLYVSQSHKWRAFLTEAMHSPFKKEHEGDARQTGSGIADILEEDNKVCDPRVPSALRRVVDELDISDDTQGLSVYNAFASEENTLRSLIAWTFREAKRIGKISFEHIGESLHKIVGEKMAILILKLLGSAAVKLLKHMFPQWFGWLEHAAKLFGDDDK